jgi:chemotaxis methyl-accepting protein methylase
VVEWLRVHRGVDFGAYRPATLQRRLALHAQASGASDVHAYVTRLETDEHEAERLIARLTIKVSSFFRGATAFNELRALVRQRQALMSSDEPFRVWSAACANGEEAYSLSMLLTEELPQTQPRLILGTDIDGTALAVAREATYPVSAVQPLPADFPAHRVNRGGATLLALNQSVTRDVVFQVHDLCSGVVPDPGPFDLILCRNVLIYWSRPMQERIQSLLLSALRPGGILCLGETEWVSSGVRAALDPVNPRQRVFRKSTTCTSAFAGAR